MSRKLIKRVVVLGTALAIIICIQIQAANCVVYKVKKGDTLWDIARSFEIDIEDVISYNSQIANPDLIYPDDQVYVPVDVVEREPSSSNTENTENGGTMIATPENNENEPEETTPNETPEEENAAGENTSGENTNNGNRAGNSQAAEGKSDLESQVLALVNQERAKAGLSALTLNQEITKVARIKSQDMIDQKYFGHNSPTYGSPSQMLSHFGVSYRTSGENIAYGQKTAQLVMNTWMNSAGHRANILGSSYTQIGIGCVSMSNGTLYWTQLFIS